MQNLTGIKEVNKEFTPELIDKLKSLLVKGWVENMSTKDLVSYVSDDLDRYYEKMSDTEFIDEAKSYWEEHFNDVVSDIKES